MKKSWFIGTFGVGHKLSKKYQPIMAIGSNEANQIMQEIHGTNYAFIYTEEQFDESKEKGFFKDLKPLKLIS